MSGISPEAAASAGSDPAHEVRLLRRTLRDVVALSTLPAISSGLGREGIARSLFDVLRGLLAPDLLFLHLPAIEGEPAFELLRASDRVGEEALWRAALTAILTSDRSDPPSAITVPGGGVMSVAIARFGIEDGGVLVAGSRSPGFPTERDRLLLGIGANQTAIVLQRKRAEEAARDQGERLRTTLTSIGDGVITTDAEGRVTDLNAVAQELTGWSNADAAGQPLEAVFDIVSEETRARVESPARRALREGRVVGLANHTLLVARDGTERPIDDSAAPIRSGDGATTGCVLVFRDVTERRAAERQVQRSEERYRALVMATSQIVWSTDPDGRVEEDSPTWRAFTGLAVEEWLGGSGWLNAVHPDDRAAAAARWQRAFEAKAPYVSEYRLRRFDGEYRVTVARGVPVLTPEGTIREWVGTNTDVTEQRRAEVELRERELRYRLVSDAANDAIWDWDLVTNQVTWNEGVQARFGYAQVGPDAAWWVENIHPEDRERIVHGIHAVIDGHGGSDRWEDDYRYRRADGSYAAVSDRGRVLRDAAGRPLRMVGAMIDLTERRGAEAALREMDDLLRLALSTAEAGLWSLDAQTGATRWSEECHRLHGTDPATFPPTVEAWLALLPVDDRQIAMERVRRAIEEGGDLDLECRILHPRHGPRWLWKVGRTQRDADGRPVQLAGITLDVTVRKRAEEAVRESEAHFRAMADNAPTMLWVTDHSGACTYLSKQWYEFTGRSPAQDLGFGSFENIHPDDAASAQRIFMDANARGAPFSMEYRLRRRDGEYRWVTDVGLPRRDSSGAFQGLIGTVTDVHERTLGEQASRFLAAAGGALAQLTDPDSTLQKLAALAVSQFADWCAVDMVDENGERRRVAVQHRDPTRVGLALDLERRYPHRSHDPHGVSRVLRTGEPELVEGIPDAMLTQVARDAEHLRLLRTLGLRAYMCVPIKSHARTLGAITFVLDQAGRRYSPADLVVAGDLAHRAAIAIENATLYRALKEADRRKDEFLATLAHELRNPLAPIRNALRVLTASGDPRDSAQARAIMERQLEQMVRLVDDLMDVGRITRNKLELRKERVELAEVVRSAIETSRPLIDHGGHELTVSLPDRPVHLDADPTRLAQVFLNLLNNSAKYTARGGHIALSAEVLADEVVVTVRDDGMGMTLGTLRTVFTMFSQGEDAGARSQGGLGIGLSLVRRIVELHGGRVDAHSDGPDQGSTLTVLLPALPERPVTGAAAAPVAAPVTDETTRIAAATSSLRVLVVDDNQDSAASLQMFMELEGHEALTAHDGEQALAVAEANRPDLILLDIGLPRLDGHEVCRRIRGEAWGRETVIVALTGWGQAEDKRRSRDAGFDRHLVKPVNLTVLTELLAELRRS